MFVSKRVSISGGPSVVTILDANVLSSSNIVPDEGVDLPYRSPLNFIK